jgi:hypothetical protein
MPRIGAEKYDEDDEDKIVSVPGLSEWCPDCSDLV